MVSPHYTPPQVTACAWPAVGGRLTGPVDGQPFEPLTQAEARVLFLLQQGLSNKDISNVLHRAVPTIKNQVASCLRKYRVPSRARLLVLSHRPREWLPPR